MARVLRADMTILIEPEEGETIEELLEYCHEHYGVELCRSKKHMEIQRGLYIDGPIVQKVLEKIGNVTFTDRKGGKFNK